MQPVFGRTNVDFPRVWLSPQLPRSGDRASDPAELAEAAASSGAVIDPSSSPSLWGALLRGKAASLLLTLGRDYERATDSDHAATLVQASLLALLSSLGRDQVDFLFLPVHRMVEEHQIAGALEGMEMARQEGLVRFFGLSAKGPGLAVLSFWQFHDAFEAILMPRDPSSDSYEILAPLAHNRRTASAICQPLTWGGAQSLARHPQVQAAAATHGVDAGSALIAWQARDHAVLVGVAHPDEVKLARDWPQALGAADDVRQAALAVWEEQQA